MEDTATAAPAETVDTSTVDTGEATAAPAETADQVDAAPRPS